MGVQGAVEKAGGGCGSTAFRTGTETRARRERTSAAAAAPKKRHSLTQFCLLFLFYFFSVIGVIGFLITFLGFGRFVTRGVFESV
jgi:hypothetical protein